MKKNEKLSKNEKTAMPKIGRLNLGIAFFSAINNKLKGYSLPELMEYYDEDPRHLQRGPTIISIHRFVL